MDGKLILEDGSVFLGKAFGASRSCAGEVVFNTGMVGYPETFTDPSYAGQILVCTYPLIGNYGIPDDGREHGLLKNFESEKIHIQGLIVQEHSEHHDHYNAIRGLDDWLRENNVPALHDVDTRALTKKIREHGVLRGRIIIGPEDEIVDPGYNSLVSAVSVKHRAVYGAGSYRILLIDCGAKNSIIFELLKRDITVIRVPFDYDYHSAGEQYDGILISNGPGDPKDCLKTIKHIRRSLSVNTPVFGICLGNQILALAAGADTYKLKYGHRSQNQPCIEIGTQHAFVTSQNHGYAVDASTLPDGWVEWFSNANDETNEGIRHLTRPFFSVQFHPEASPGPKDTAFLFDVFIDVIQSRKMFTVNAQECVREHISKVVILGSGGLKIGQAGEFDYSGSQAIKALQEEHIETILINPNIATIQTSEGMADKTYFLPVNPEFVEQVIEKERPEGILLAFGGQTALNCGVELERSGVLQKFGVKVLGTPVRSIIDTEDRGLFVKRLDEIGIKSPRSVAACSVDEALLAADSIGYPVMIRLAYALGGRGSGICSSSEDLVARCSTAFSFSPQVLVEEWLGGWKEIEYEVVRDMYDNCITVCNMENLDPLGIHTGESIVVAPSQTLNNHEYHLLRDIAVKVIRHLGIIGECNIQYAFDPKSDDYRVIEVNARLSRSSALASKATGYPLAFIATKLSLGYALHELDNKITKITKSFFEPALDYVVVKIPRWDLQKFKNVSSSIGSEMKSVGEVMGIGRSFEEALQKAIRMTGIGVHGIISERFRFEDIMLELVRPSDKRIFAIAKAYRAGWTTRGIHDATKINSWFLEKIKNIIDCQDRLVASLGKSSGILEVMIRRAKKLGFDDYQIASLMNICEHDVRSFRNEHFILPAVKQIDTLAAEYPAHTNYLYFTYNGSESDITPNPGSVVVLGSGAYRIGSSVEFDWCGVNAVSTARKLGFFTIMLNYNPETVSTDYDVCDKLYFDEISYERILDISDIEKPYGVIVSVGGQTPNNLAIQLDNAGIRILGTSADSIDRAEDRHKFSRLLDSIAVDQPEWKELVSLDEARIFAHNVGYPVLIRPSYVLSGAAMNVAWDDESLEKYLAEASEVSSEHPVVITKFIENSKEIEIDAVAKDGEVVIYAVTEHIENAGVHSGDATIMLPAQKLYIETIRQVKRITRAIARELRITGPFNIQFLAYKNNVKVIECNLRASRSFPFCSKVFKQNMIEMATRAILGIDVKPVEKSALDLDYVGIKVAQFSFSRLKGADPALGVEMASTGEVGCIGHDLNDALLKAMISAGFFIPKKGILLSTGPIESKARFLESAIKLKDLGFRLYATPGTARFLLDNHIFTELVYWPSETRQSNVTDHIMNKNIDLIINIPNSNYRNELENDYRIRRMAVDHDIPLITNIQLAIQLAEALEYYKRNRLDIRSWDEY